MTNREAKEVFLNRGFVNGIFDGDKWRQSCVVISKWLEQEPCDCISREFIEIVVEYPPADLCTYPEYKGKPYFSIKYRENGKYIIGYGSYKIEMISQWIKEYFMPRVQPKPIECEDSISRAEAMTEVMMFAGNVKSDEEDVYIKVSDAVQLLRELPPANLQEPCGGCDYKEWLKGEVEPKTDVLDKIRAEIKEESRFCPLTEGLERALEIIDKYTAESEE